MFLNTWEPILWKTDLFLNAQQYWISKKNSTKYWKNWEWSLLRVEIWDATFTKMPLIVQAQKFCHYKHYILPYIFEKIIKGRLQNNLPSFSYPPLKSRKISLFNAIPSIVKIEAHSKLSEMLKHHVREIRIYALWNEKI